MTNSSASYFTDISVLNNVPVTMLYLSAIYGVIFVLGLMVIVEAPSGIRVGIKFAAQNVIDVSTVVALSYGIKDEETEKPKLMMRLKSAWMYMYKVACRDYNFYLLWMGRYLYLTIDAGVLSHWKTYSFTLSSNDQIMATAGGVRYEFDKKGALIS